MIGKNKEKLEIETLPVEIKVIRVGGHKMTKAVWNQIQCQDYNEGDKILGYIVGEREKYYDDSGLMPMYKRKKWILFISANKQELRKSEMYEWKRWEKYMSSIPQLFIAT